MDDELIKSFTDCVYFLASPLTCKKGIECEYRHSELARLNPRDCRYQLGGGCFNPTCAFRHPPLESHPENSSELAPLPNKSAVPVYKTDIPCFFYFNGYCNKGERCSFLHGPDDGTAAGKSTEVAYGVPDDPTAEKKTSSGSEAGPPGVKKHPDSSEMGPKAAAHEHIESNMGLHLMATDVGEQSASHETSGSPSEEPTAVRLDSLLPAEGLTQGGYYMFPNQSSDKEMEDNVEREEWLESSPGFDVIVGDRVEGLTHEDERNYLMHHDMKDRELDEQFAGYDFGNNLEYDPAHPDLGIFSGKEQDASYYNFEKHEMNECVRETLIPAYGKSASRKRELPRELAFHGRGNADLRDLLKKQQTNESDSPYHLSRRFDLSRSEAHEQGRDRRRPQGSRFDLSRSNVREQGRDRHHPQGSQFDLSRSNVREQGWDRHRPQGSRFDLSRSNVREEGRDRHRPQGSRFDLSRSNVREQGRDKHRPQGSQWMPQRKASKVESNASSSPSFLDRSHLEGANRLKRSKQSQGSSYRHQHFKDRRQDQSRHFADEPPRRRMASRKRLTEEDPKMFAAPKTLAQIREEKRRRTEDANPVEGTGPSGGRERGDFAGPKSLSEILSDKRKVSSVLSH